MKGYRLYLQDQPLTFLLMSGGRTTWTSFHREKPEMTMRVGLILEASINNTPHCASGGSGEREKTDFIWSKANTLQAIF